MTLRDGTAVLLRQIRPQDRDRLAAGLRELSPESRHLRFNNSLAELTAEQLTSLTEVDHVDHEADGLWRVDLELPKRGSDLPDSPAGRAFAAAAKERCRLANLLRPVLASRLRRHERRQAGY